MQFNLISAAPRAAKLAPPAPPLRLTLPRTTPEVHGHLPALDGVRGLAIVLVLFHHFTILSGTSLLDRAIFQLGALGASGVDLFFVLSGFLITGILFDSKGSDGFFRNFYARRTLRIFPLYYAVVIIALVVLPRVPSSAADPFREPVDVWSYWLYLSNLSMGWHGEFRHGILDVTWSLAIEEQFYLVWPAVVWGMGRAGLMRLCGGLVVAALIVRGALLLADVNHVAVYLLTPCRMEGLAVGALIALASRGAGGAGALVRPAKFVASIAAALLAIVLLVGGFEYWDATIGLLLTPTLFAALYGAILVLILAGTRGGSASASPLTRAFSHPALRLFGKYSYALYLFHVPVGATLAQSIYGPERFPALGASQLPGQLLFYLAATGISLGAAVLSWSLFEKQFLKLKRYFPSGRAGHMPPVEFHDRPIPVGRSVFPEGTPAASGGAK